MSAAVQKRQAPVDGTVEEFSQFFRIVTHPALRLGFLDARDGRTIDHDKIIDRIYRETPKGALKRLGFDESELLTRHDIALAQYRYEEGRLLYLDIGLRCKAWGRPDYPPKAVMTYIQKRAQEAGAKTQSLGN